MASNNTDALTAELMELADKFRDRKMSESVFRRKARALLEANKVNISTQNQKFINDLLKFAKAERELIDSLDSLTSS